jgi:hypothetical protein
MPGPVLMLNERAQFGEQDLFAFLGVRYSLHYRNGYRKLPTSYPQLGWRSLRYGGFRSTGRMPRPRRLSRRCPPRPSHDEGRDRDHRLGGVSAGLSWVISKHSPLLGVRNIFQQKKRECPTKKGPGVLSELCSRESLLFCAESATLLALRGNVGAQSRIIESNLGWHL